MTTQLQVRRDTAANWTSANPTLLSGEIGFESDTNRIKMGDGTTAWTSLLYLAVTGGYGAGFSNMEVFTTGTSATWNLPTYLRVSNAKFKITILGGGGQGGGTSTTAGQTGSGGGGGGGVIRYFTYVAGQNSATYTVGAGGSGAGTNATGNNGASTTFIYNSVTTTAGGGTGGGTHAGSGGAGGTATGGALNVVGDSGTNGGTMAATSNYQGAGGNSPFGLGFGGEMPGTAAGAAGNAGALYGGGGSGGRNGTGTTARAGGAGAAGVVIIEY
jgi:hypothetical protein